MRIRPILAAAALVALPLGLPSAMAAPAAPGAAQAVSTVAKAPVINVRKGGGFGGFRGGYGGGGFKARSFGGGGPRFRNFSTLSAPRSFSRGAYRARTYSGPKFAYRGGRHYGNWYGGRRGHHFRRRIIIGAPYYYYPDYYDDYYDYGDVGYSDDAMARCAARYRSFDPSTGTFLGNDGRRHLCPYLE